MMCASFRRVAFCMSLAVLMPAEMAAAQRFGEYSLVPVGVVGGNPPGTLISGNSITIPNGGVDVEFEIRATWGGEPDLRMAVAQCKIDGTNGFDNGAGAPLTWKNQGVVGTGAGTQTEGAYIASSVCQNNSRPGCPSPGTPASGQAPCDIPTEGPCVPNVESVIPGMLGADGYGVIYKTPDYEYLVIASGGAAQPENPPTVNDYLGTAIFEVPAAAAGTYVIGFVPDLLFTYMSDPDVVDIPLGPSPGTYDYLEPGQIIVTGLLVPPLAITSYPHGVRKQRYISFAPQPSQVASSFRVEDVGSGMKYYISTPRTTPDTPDYSIVGQGLTFVVSDTSPIIYNWSDLPAIHVGGCMIAPGDQPGVGRSYEVTATTDGIDFSSPITVFTAEQPTDGRFWADVVGHRAPAGDSTTTPPTPVGAWTPPEKVVTGRDIASALESSTQAPNAPHFTWTDIHGEPTDRKPNGPDVLRILNAFSSGSGKEYYPYPYPQLPCLIHDPVNPPSPALCPPPPLMAALSP